jgi:heterodisulfide reductase subunit C
MYAARYGNLYQARDTLNGLHLDNSVHACADCGQCSARCVRSVNIPRRIDELRALLA